jgi:hypothetical protein
VIPAVRLVLAAETFLFDVSDFAVRRDFAIVACDAAAAERRESEEANKAHHDRAPAAASASLVPKSSQATHRVSLDTDSRSLRLVAENVLNWPAGSIVIARRRSGLPCEDADMLNPDNNLLDRGCLIAGNW